MNEKFKKKRVKSRSDPYFVWIMEGIFPSDSGYYARRIILLLDQAVGLPVKISIFYGSDRLVEEYAFRSLKFNVELTKEDFNPANPAYHYFKSLIP